MRAAVSAIVLGHAKRPSDASPSSFAFAPGISIGGTLREGAWELDVSATGAHMSRSAQQTIPARPDGAGGSTYSVSETTSMLSAGTGARWFAASSAHHSMFLGIGIEVMVLEAGTLAGFGPAARVGGGIELWQDSAHNRVAIELSATLPTFRLEGVPLATPAASTTGSGAPLVYVVPVVAALRWTL